MEWTPIEEKLPPLGVPLFVTIHDKLYFKPKVLFPVYYIKKPHEQGYGFAFERFDNIFDIQYNEVKAWATKPEPYEYDVI